MRLLLIVFGLSISAIANAQDYDSLAAKADSLFARKDYKNAVNYYTAAFKARRWKGLVDHRYQAGAAWAMIGVRDSAFFSNFQDRPVKCDQV